MKIALFGGTFDPIHIGHLILAKEALDIFSLSKVIFIPTGIPPHKENKNISDGVKRLEMVKVAIQDEPKFEISSYEIHKRGISYSVDTIRHFKASYGNEVELYYIIGADQVMMLKSWKSAEEIASLCHIIGAYRPGYDLSKIDEEIMRYQVKLLEIPQVDISASDLRRRVRVGKSIRYQTTDEVIEYIDRHKMYIGDEFE